MNPITHQAPSYLQAQSQLSRFDDYGRRAEEAKMRTVPATPAHAKVAEVPVKYEEYYDPNDPRSDWSGFVPLPKGRAHYGDPVTGRVQVKAGEKGFVVPGEGVDTSDWKKPGRRAPDQNRNPNRSTPGLLGGPVPVDRRYADNDRFTTEAMTAMNSHISSSTTLSQMTQQARNRHVPGKKPVEPMYESHLKHDPSLSNAIRSENPYALNGSAPPPTNSLSQMVSNSGLDNSNLVGYRSHHGGQMQSLTGSLAKDIVGIVEKPKVRAREEWGDKSIVEGGYGRGIPGYTGTRR